MSNWFRRLYEQLPVIRELRNLRQELRQIAYDTNRCHSILASRYEEERLLTRQKHQHPLDLSRHERQVYSQNGEDGIIEEIFRRIGTTDRTFVEIGVGNGLENNTVYLLEKGWRGWWIDGSEAGLAQVERDQSGRIGNGTLKLQHALLTAENVETVLRGAGVPEKFDLLSLDIDRNTYHVWKALKSFKPRVLVIEYNSSWPADCAWTIPYHPERVWNYSAYFGGSLKAMELLGRELGYSLVVCDLHGINAFFVQNELLGDRFNGPFTAEHHYEPPRYWLARREGHARSVSDDPSVAPR